ncbi:MAG: hypothetical protein M3137_05510, partial [Actinomycetota bacterium]|nr:hypothetical protein [Actinomycetota bacterium]
MGCVYQTPGAEAIGASIADERGGTTVASMPAARRVVLPAALAAVTALAGCGSSSSERSPTAGHATPAAATVGFLQGATANKGIEACSYVAPPQSPVCTSAFSSGTSTISVHNLHVGATTVSGDRALVTALGTLCTNSSSKVCFASNKSDAGQPTGTNSFDEAYSAVESGSSPNNDPAIPCTRINGDWYVDLGESSSAPSPATTTTKTAPSTTLAPQVPSTP